MWPPALPILLLPAMLLPVACAPGPAPEPAAEGSPIRNVVLVLADTLRRDHLGAYGYSRRTSPAIDAFAAGAVLFEQAASQASCTFPSANSILTSRWPAHFLDRPKGALGIPEAIPGLAEILHARGLRTVAVSASPVVRATPSWANREGGFGRGFDVFDESCLGRDARCVNAAALEQLPARAAAAPPFFLYLHYMDPHDPYLPPPEHERRFAGPYQGKEFIAAGNPNPVAKWLYADGPDPQLGEGDLEHLIALYDESIAFFDAELGRLLEALGERGLLGTTLVALVSDHGEEFLEHGHIKHCRTLYETELATPLVLSVPGGPAGLRVAGPVRNLDLAPTILDYLGADPEAHGFEGRSLRPRVEGHADVPPADFAWQAKRRSIREGPEKLIFRLGGSWELFDLETDPHETHNLAAERPREVARLRGALEQQMASIDPVWRAHDPLERGRELNEQLRALGYLQ